MGDPGLDRVSDRLLGQTAPADAPDGIERTIVRPRHGAHPRAQSAPAAWPERAASGPTGTPLDESARRVGDNPLLWQLEPLLAAASRLRRLATHPDPAALREQLTGALRAFEREASAAGVGRDRIVAARYVVCTFLDESAASTPWGGAGAWARDTLLVRFHGEAWGGEKVFQLLARLMQDPAGNRDLLELIHACLALGFEGRYRVVGQGGTQLEQVRERLYQVLRQGREPPGPLLSPHAAPMRPAPEHRADAARLQAFGALAVLVVAGWYAFYAIRLGTLSDSALDAVQAVRLPRPAVAQPWPAARSAPIAAPCLARFLEPEIREGLVQVHEQADRSTVTLRGDGMFEPGRAEVLDRFRPVVERIALGLAEQAGPIVISGHSDDQPIRSARFASNWHLSQARARMVEQLLAERLPAQRLRAEGRADAEPIAPNDTPAGRARNRRVEITLLCTAPAGRTS